MFDSKKTPGRRRPGKNVFTTKSGNTIKLNRSLGERVKANREAKARKRAAYLSSLPNNRFKRLLYRLHPKRVAKYWFSREGALMALKLSGVGIIVFFLMMVGIFAYFRKDLPNIKDISGNDMAGSITYFDRTGQIQLFQDYDAVKRIPVTGDNISKYVKQATIATEDKNFYKHGAFDVQGIMRAVVKDVTHGGAVQGGSTITQQLVKLTRDWTEDRSITRKFKELILAVELEREYSKEDILNGYLNIAPYGNIQNGVESAARDYFHKSAKDLTLPESAMLAAIPKSPSYYSPYGQYYDKELLRDRQKYILDQMAKENMITKQEAEDAKKVDVIATVQDTKPKYEGIKAPYFVLAAKAELEQKYGSNTVKRGGWQVITSVDMRLQELAEKQVTNGIRQVQRQGGNTAAFAAADVKTGQMVAVVGGPNFNDPDNGYTNNAQTWLPPGSSFKPYDYVTMINETDNTGAGSVLYDTQGSLAIKGGNDYPCTVKTRPKEDKNANCLWDYDFIYPGPITLRYALGGSRNVPAVKAMLTAGTDKVRETAKAMGLESGYKCFDDTAKKVETKCYGSSAIGDGAYLKLDEHANALATLSRNGEALPKTYIVDIKDARGKYIKKWEQPKGNQVVRADAAYIINDILSDPNASYLNARGKFHRYKGWNFAIKTGTTNEAKDGLMVSYSTQYAAVTWVGSYIPKEMTGAMEDMTSPIIRGWMEGAHDPLKPVNWTKPSGVKTLPAYVITKKVSRLGEIIPSPNQDIYPSWYKQKSGGNSARVIDKVSKKIATSCTPDAAKENQSNGNDNIFSADIFVGAAASNTTEQDDKHKCDDTKPQVTLTPPPGSVCNTDCNFTVTVTGGTHPLSSDEFKGTVELYINGQKVDAQEASASPTTLTFNYKPTTSGSATVEARVIDSVLYSASDSTSVTMAQGGTTPTPGNP